MRLYFDSFAVVVDRKADSFVVLDLYFVNFVAVVIDLEQNFVVAAIVAAVVVDRNVVVVVVVVERSFVGQVFVVLVVERFELVAKLVVLPE